MSSLAQNTLPLSKVRQNFPDCFMLIVRQQEIKQTLITTKVRRIIHLNAQHIESAFYYQNGPNKVASEYMSDTILVLLTEYWVIPSQINTGLLLRHL